MNHILVERLFPWVLQTTTQAAVLVVLILLAQFAFRKRLSPAWRYALWLLLVVRLLMPAVPKSAYSIFNLAYSKAPLPVAALSFGEIQSTAENSKPVTPPTEPARETIARKEIAPNLPANIHPASARAEFRLNWRAAAAAVWLAGLCFGILRLLWTNFRFRRRLQEIDPSADGELLEELANCQQLLAIGERVTILKTAEVASPAIYGLRHKRLLLPVGIAQRFGREEMRHIFLHELAHVKRHDLEVNWIVAVLFWMHWFNPVLWYGFKRMKADRELATDAMALSAIRLGDHPRYGETILRLVEWIPSTVRLPNVVGIVERKTDLESRLRLIAGFGERKYWTLIALSILGVLAICVCTDMRARAAGDQPGVADLLGEGRASGQVRRLITSLKQKSRWTLGPRAVFFGDEDGEVSGGFVRGVQIRNYAMDAAELQALGGITGGALPAPDRRDAFVQWNFAGDLVSTDGKTALQPGGSLPAETPSFEFTQQKIAGQSAPVLKFSAGTHFGFAHPFRDPTGKPFVTDYTVIMDVMFPSFPSRWAALFQTDPSNTSDAEWFISAEKGIGITDNYSGRVPEGEWHRLALRIQGSEARFTSFIDGMEVQRKDLDVQDEFYNRRRDDDVISWTEDLAKLKALQDQTADTALQKFNRRLQNGDHRNPAALAITSVTRNFSVPAPRRPMDLATREWAASLGTPELIQALLVKSRWTLGPEALLFADENGENAGGFVNALQVRDYAMSEKEIAALGAAQKTLQRTATQGRIAQWDFNGTLASAVGGDTLEPAACGPAFEPEVDFAPFDPNSSGAAEVARFSRGTYFIVPLPFGTVLNYSVILDVKFDSRPVGWASLWQNDPANRTDADWFINKKQQLGIRDLYGGLIEDGQWHRLAVVVDGKGGTISHFINGRKVRTKRMIMEDDYSRRGGRERTLDAMIALINEVQKRAEPEAADLASVFARRMHNRPDPDAEYYSFPFDVHITDPESRKPLAGVKVYYQLGESNEDFYPEFVLSDDKGLARINAHAPVAKVLHLTARAPGYAPRNLTLVAAQLVNDPALRFELPLRRGMTIGGRVVDDRNQPVPNAAVSVFPVGGELTDRSVPSWADDVVTAADGSWQIAQAPGPSIALKIEIQSTSYGPRSFVVQPDEPLYQKLKTAEAVVRLEE